MRKPRRILSLDLGSTTLKLALVERTSDHLKLLEARLLEIPPTADLATRQAALQQLLQGIPLGHGTQIVSVVEDPFACIQTVLVPPMPAGELPGAIQWELQRSLAFPPEEAIVDYESLGEAKVTGAKKLKLLAAAFPGAMIRGHLAFLNRAGVRPAQLLPMASGVTGWLRRRGDLKEGPAALLYLGGNSAEFLVVQGGKLLFTRKIPLTGSDITKGMTAVLMTAQGQVGLSEAEAETIKRSVGIPKADSSELLARGISGTQLLALIRGSLERLATEVERSITFYGEFTGGSGVSQLLLVGGGAHFQGLPEWLQERLGIPVKAPDPLEGVPLNPGALGGAASAMPLSLVPALGAAFSAGIGMNLLPLEVKEAVAREVRRVALTGTFTAVILGMLLLRVGMGIYRQMLLTQIAAFRLEQAAMERELAQARVSMAAQQRAQREPLWEELFREFSQIVPHEIYLTGFTIDGRLMTLRGRVRELTRTSDLILADFLQLMGEGLLSQVRLNSTRQLEGPSRESEFEISCSIR